MDGKEFIIEFDFGIFDILSVVASNKLHRYHFHHVCRSSKYFSALSLNVLKNACSNFDTFVLVYGHSTCTRARFFLK